LALLLREILELAEESGMARGAILLAGDIRDLAEPPPAVELPLLLRDLALHAVELPHDLEVLLDVPRAEHRGALEHHVLEEGADPGYAGPLVHGADARDPSGGDVRVPLARKDEQSEA